MSVRLAPWGVVESDVIAPPVSRRGADVLSRFTAHAHGTAFWVALWIVAAAAEFGALVPVIFGREEPVPGWEFVYRLIGGSFAAAGLIAWRRRPDSRSGVLMTATGFLFFLTPLLSQVDAPVGQTLVLLTNDLWTIPFVALLLTYVTAGRMQSPVEFALVGLFVLSLVILETIWLLFLEQDGNLLVAFPNEDIAHVIDRMQRWIVLAGCLGTSAVVAARWWAASPPRRRALLPSVAGIVALLLFASLLVNDLVGTGTRSQTHLWITIASLALVPAAFLAGLLRSRLARAGLTELFASLRTMRGPDLQAALAKTMGDPGLIVARRVAGGTGYVDPDGAPVAMPVDPGDRRIVPMQRDGDEIAALVYDASLDDDPELVEAVSAAAAIALENEQLHNESHEQLAELRASRERLVAAGDAERRRLERNLHDGAQQRLVALSMQLRFLQSRIREDPATAEELATTASAELAESLQELRELARGIHPAVLDHGLEAALESVAARSPVPAALRYDVSGVLPPAVELAAYFVVSEALTNVAKYAQATAAAVHVTKVGGRVVVEVTDDGVGGAAANGGSGLRGLADRVEALDGHLHVVSPRGHGTTVTAELPCAS
jgi:signal transduction histidine kinase